MKRIILIAPLLVLAACAGQSKESDDSNPVFDTRTAILLENTMNELGDLGSKMACEKYNLDIDASFERMNSTGLDLDRNTVEDWMAKFCADD